MEFRYLNPLYFEEMISEWENVCSKNKCNYLSVEYSEFALPGGYQMAINAKPLFIQKALELCAGRNVLYIDGDMFIRKYPTIFDMTDVDFMARGWWIDPRSSCNLYESIMYDPYTFETSGGTMFFSQSKESKMLIEKWIKESDKPYNEGKADDRILSLVFNTYKLLCNMKIIQLPIEYLWLSLDYDERLIEDGYYDYNVAKMNQSIFIEHPECLTSEETATGSGASNDRTPKFYNFIEESLSPVSEQMHEYILFPDKEMSAAFKDYFDFMSNITYIDDGNDSLIKKGFVNPEDPFASESPIYVVKYEDKYGNTSHSSGEMDEGKKLTVNEIVDINLKAAENMDISNLPIVDDPVNKVQIINGGLKKEDGKPDRAKTIRLIIKLLKEGKYVIHNPVPEQPEDEKVKSDRENYNAVLMRKIEMYKNLDFVFSPEIKSYEFGDFFKPKMQINMPMLFCPGNEILIKFLSMFLSLDELSDYLNYGSYEFMSRIRVGYLFKSKPTKAEAIVGGGEDNFDKNITEYENGLEMMYSPNVQNDQNVQNVQNVQNDQRVGGKKTIKKRSKSYKSSHKKVTRRRK